MSNLDKLFKSLRTLRWVWFWSGNWPLLDCITERDAGFEKEFKKLAGVYPQITVDLYQDGLLTAYHCQAEYNRLEKYLVNKFKENLVFILQSLKDYEVKTKKDIDSIKSLVSKDFYKYSGGELANLFLEVRKYWQYNSAVDHWAWYTERFFTPLLEKNLSRYLRGNQADISEYINILVSPRKPSEIYKERVAFYKLAKKIYNRLNIKKAKTLAEVKTKYPQVFKLIQLHVRQYGWVSVLVNNPPVTEQDVWQELREKLKGKLSLELEVKRLGDNFSRSILTKKAKVIKRLKPDLETKMLIKTLERVAYVRTQDNAVMSRSAFLAIPLYQEAAKRLGVTYYQLKELTPEEIALGLKNKKKLQSLVRSRHKLSGYVVYKGLRICVDGSRAGQLKKIIEKSLNTLIGDGNKYQGTPASLGKARGRAVVAMSSRQANLVKLGDILIAPATSADFVPAMRKAKAIVTQMGGLTSHAAVVAREFGVPCIVGLANATLLFKTGDLVEVDANKGTIKKVK